MTEFPHISKTIDSLKSTDICLTGMRPSGRLHLGHYKWALENWVHVQNAGVRCNFLIADYQVLWDHLWETDRLRQSVVDMVADWMAVGLDPLKSNFVVQSYVPEFAELFNFLTMFVPYSLATNNPTLKEEMKKIVDKEQESSISLGFVNYPVSQVADIMLLGGTVVPVGEDQIPHIELARKIIKRVNTLYGTEFRLPKALISPTPRLVWTDGNDKMSKSLGNTIFLTATEKEIVTQVGKMYTDPGKTSISAKWDISRHVPFLYLDIFFKGDKKIIDELKERYTSGGDNSIGDGEIKKLLIQTLEDTIHPIRERREELLKNPKIIQEAIIRGSSNARLQGQELLATLKWAMGLLNYGNY